MAPSFSKVSVPAPSPLVGEGGRRPDEGEARRTGLARSLRRRSTDAEIHLWQLLRDRRFAGFKFRRQVPIGPFVADFACYKAKLVVELDGSQHAENARDERRDAEIQRRRFCVFRIWNNQLNSDRDAVLDAIWQALNQTPSSALRAPSPTGGEGEGAATSP